VTAEPEGYARTFLAEGPPLVALLEAAVAHGVAPTAARRLLGAGDRPRRQPLAEPLSERELEVLRLLATDLDGPDIARELVVALSTVRSHTKSIYAKLGVNSRRAAIRRADELGLTATRR
jgi:LuxR family maltose regulon positive regulatory protein